MALNYPRLALALLFSVYFLWIAADPMQGSFLDNVDLAIHETGHLVFRAAGEFIGVAGGSLLQLIIPATFVGYFIRREQIYSAGIVSFWVGQSLLNVYVYASDAVAMQIVLTSGLTGSEGSFHDWNYMLTEMGLIGSTKIIAGLIRMLGTLIIIGGVVVSLYYSAYAVPDTE